MNQYVALAAAVVGLTAVGILASFLFWTTFSPPPRRDPSPPAPPQLRPYLGRVSRQRVYAVRIPEDPEGQAEVTRMTEVCAPIIAALHGQYAYTVANPSICNGKWFFRHADEFEAMFEPAQD